MPRSRSGSSRRTRRRRIGPKDKSYDEAFHNALALQYTDPPGPLAEAYLAAKNADPQATFDKALDQSLDAQLAQLQAQLDQAFQDALDRRQSPEKIGGPPSQRKRAIARLLFNLVDALPSESPGGAAPKLDLMENPGYKRFILVVGVREAVHAVNDAAGVLDEVADETQVERKRLRGIFAGEHGKVVQVIQDKTVAVEMHDLLLKLKQKELGEHEEALKKRRLDVDNYQKQLEAARQETAGHLKELRLMSENLFRERVKLRDATLDNQKLEKTIRRLEEGL